MYEKNPGAWSAYDCDYPLLHENVMSVWPAGEYAFVNWAGHGSPTSTHIMGLGAPAFITSSDCPLLNDDYPAIVFAAACSNSDTDSVNIGQAMMQRGAVGFLGATKVAFGFHDWDDPYDGTTASMDYFFTTRVTSGDYTQGAAHQWALREMYTHGLWYYDKYETFEWGALWGNPNLGMTAALALGIVLPDGAPDYLAPGVPATIAVRIEEGTESVLPDSATLHYRFDGGTFLTDQLTPLGGNLYEAVVPPATCDATPEFYFSVTGDGGTTVYNPSGAPEERYAAEVATVTAILDDNCETDQGWTVENVDLVGGAWERGIPIGGGDRGDPPSDFDGSGRCYLTDNRVGNSDVDGGPTMLISPLLDLSITLDPVLRYARWWYNDDLDEDRLVVEVSDDDGESWALIESVPDTEGWVEREVYLGAYVSLTSQVRLRFSAADTPNNSVDEAAIDAVSIVDIWCVMADDGDFDDDDDVDLTDFAVFTQCLGGPGVTTPPPGCHPADFSAADFEGDGDVDLGDYQAFVVNFTG